MPEESLSDILVEMRKFAVERLRQVYEVVKSECVGLILVDYVRRLEAAANRECVKPDWMKVPIEDWNKWMQERKDYREEVERLRARTCNRFNDPCEALKSFCKERGLERIPEDKWIEFAAWLFGTKRF